MRSSDFILAYFSPETLLPATSIVATIAGIVMMVGRGSLRYVIRSSRQGLRRTGRIAGTSKPHLRLHDEARSEAPGR
jgi:hypothetical protein